MARASPPRAPALSDPALLAAVPEAPTVIRTGPHSFYMEPFVYRSFKFARSWDRQRVLVILLSSGPKKISELKQAAPDWWSGDHRTTESRRLYRDLHGIGAEIDERGQWRMPTVLVTKETPHGVRPKRQRHRRGAGPT